MLQLVKRTGLTKHFHSSIPLPGAHFHDANLGRLLRHPPTKPRNFVQDAGRHWLGEVTFDARNVRSTLWYGFQLEHWWENAQARGKSAIEAQRWQSKSWGEPIQNASALSNPSCSTFKFGKKQNESSFVMGLSVLTHPVYTMIMNYVHGNDDERGFELDIIWFEIVLSRFKTYTLKLCVRKIVPEVTSNVVSNNFCRRYQKIDVMYTVAIDR